MWRGGGADGPRSPEHADADVVDGGARLVAQLLRFRGVADAEAAAFLAPTLADGLRSPRVVAGLTVAATVLAETVPQRREIFVEVAGGVDGIAAAAILVGGLRAFGAIAWAGATQAAAGGLSVSSGTMLESGNPRAARIVLCDGGTAVVADPTGAEVTVCFADLSRSGVAFYLLAGVRMVLGQRGDTIRHDLRGYLDLVALGTIAAGTKLRDENRVFVACGLRQMDRAPRAGLQAVKSCALVERTSVQEMVRRIIPRLWSHGDEYTRLLELLTTESAERAEVLAAEMEVRYAERRVRGEWTHPSQEGEAGEQTDGELIIDAELSLAHITPRLVATLTRLAPHGPGNPAPSFLVRGAEIVSARIVGNASRPHLRVRLKQDGRTMTGLGFELGRSPVHAGMHVDVVCRPGMTVWHGVERLRLEIRAIRPSELQSSYQIPENMNEYGVP